MGSEQQENEAAAPDYLLSFLCDGGDQIYVHADEAGLEQLSQTVQMLLRKVREVKCEHEHLVSDEWGGGGELTPRTPAQIQQPDCTPVHHVKIYAWTPEWKEKNVL